MPKGIDLPHYHRMEALYEALLRNTTQRVHLAIFFVPMALGEKLKTAVDGPARPHEIDDLLIATMAALDEATFVCAQAMEKDHEIKSVAESIALQIDRARGILEG